MVTTARYTSGVKRAIQIAQAIAKEHQHSHFSPAHFLKGVLHNEIGLASVLATWGIDIHYLRDWADIRIASCAKSSAGVSEPPGDDQVVGLIEVADVARLKLSEDEISPLAILLAMCKPNIAFTEEQLKSFPLTERMLIEATLQEVGIQNATQGASETGGTAAPQKRGGKWPSLLKYCHDITEKARAGSIDPIIGRNGEIRMMMETLGRRRKPNVIITGEPGVGKTALVDGFARAIVAEEVPERLLTASIYELDMGALIAGASYKGEIEDRLKKIVSEVKQHGQAILFIDEIHLLLDPASGAAGTANLLKPELARGELTVIGATTNEEFREFIEEDDAFMRRFERLKVAEPDATTTVRMLEKLLPHYEAHHELEVESAVLPETVRLAKRYIQDRRLPDAAIDLMDRTMAAIRMMSESSAGELERLQGELDELKEKNTDQTTEVQLADLRWLYREMEHRLSPILLGMLEDETDTDQLKVPAAFITYLQGRFVALQPLVADAKSQVTPQDVAAVVANQTGIPLGKIQSKEAEKLLHMEDYLRERVVGQDHALQVLSEAVRISRSNLDKPGLPIGSFFLTGPTGTGKTELAKSVAEFLFDDEKALLRFDMSEFKEEHSAALLYGAPPGYVGYKEGGLLVNKIRQQPYAVVLFDEIEKAHPSVFDIFLQILDEGKLSDKLGKVGDFSNAIILFTSNIGSQFVAQAFADGKTPASDDLRDIMAKHFRPEFLGRLTDIVPFATIGEEVIFLIFKIQLKSLLQALDNQGISLELSDAVMKKLADEGFKPKFGARPLRGVIRNRLQRPISRLIISGEVKAGQTIVIDLKDGKLNWEIKK